MFPIARNKIVLQISDIGDLLDYEGQHRLTHIKLRKFAEGLYQHENQGKKPKKVHISEKSLTSVQEIGEPLKTVAEYEPRFKA